MTGSISQSPLNRCLVNIIAKSILWVWINNKKETNKSIILLGKFVDSKSSVSNMVHFIVFANRL